MNVETVRQRKHSSERYSFREHAAGRWSLEHIHAQNAEQLNRAEQWKEWLRLHRKALMTFDDIDQTEKEAVLDKVDQVLASPTITEADFRPLERELTELLSAGTDSSDGDVDSIANLALLDGGDNSALSNSVFAVKRAAILERDRQGSYIPVCTRNVFLKYYSPADEHQMHFWSASDREHYLDAMLAVLRRLPHRRDEEDVIVKGYLTSYSASSRHSRDDVPSVEQHRDPAHSARLRPGTSGRSGYGDPGQLPRGPPGCDRRRRAGRTRLRVRQDRRRDVPSPRWQQRLTTLFLLHWYLASAADRLDAGAAWTRFSYATRASARLFCERLAANPLPQDEDVPSAWIIDQPWYLYVWRTDPTIQSMLVMIDAIHREIQRLHPDLDARAAWERLTRAESPAVSFYLLPLDDMESDEDLYIKMNSRGKPLTPFENFKARFEQDIQHSDRADEFAHKIDGAWSDLLWPFHGGDNIVDDEFIRYIGFITELCEFREGRVVYAGRLGPRARAVFGEGNERANEHLDFLFGRVRQVAGRRAHQQDLQRCSVHVTAGRASDYDWQKVVLFGATSTNLFEQCLRCTRLHAAAEPAAVRVPPSPDRGHRGLPAQTPRAEEPHRRL